MVELGFKPGLCHIRVFVLSPGLCCLFKVSRLFPTTVYPSILMLLPYVQAQFLSGLYLELGLLGPGGRLGKEVSWNNAEILKEFRAVQ